MMAVAAAVAVMVLAFRLVIPAHEIALDAIAACHVGESITASGRLRGHAEQDTLTRIGR